MKQIYKYFTLLIVVLSVGIGSAWGATKVISYEDSELDTETTISGSNASSGSAGRVSWSATSATWNNNSEKKRWEWAANSSITFSVSSGYNITQVVIKTTSTTQTISVTSPSGTTITGNKSTNCSITDINATSVTIAIPQAGAYYIKNENVYVYYTSSASCDTDPLVGDASSSAVSCATATVSCEGIVIGDCDIAEYGFFYKSGSSGVTTSDTKVQVSTGKATSDVDAYEKAMTDLSPNTKYYFKPYAKVGSDFFLGDEINFTTKKITASSSNTTYGTVSRSGMEITGSLKSGGKYSSPAYTVTAGNGTTTVERSGNKFTVSTTSTIDVAVRINFEDKGCTEHNGDDVVGGSSTSYTYGPVDNYYKYSTRQILYTKTDLNLGSTKKGTIKSILFEYAYTTVMSKKTDVDIYMANTYLTGLSTSSYVPYSEFTKVYSGAFNFTNGWNEVFLDTEFEYNGAGNLVVMIDDNSGAYETSSYVFKYHSYSGGQIYSYSDTNNENPSTTTWSSYTASDTRPNTKFCIEESDMSTYTVNWYVNGSIEHSQTNYAGTTLTGIPTPDSEDCDGEKVFLGWYSSTYKHATDAPDFVSPTIIPHGGANYYAVFADADSTSSYEQITRESDLTAGAKYLIVGNKSSTYEALPVGSATSLTSVSPTSSTISSPSAALIWTLEGTADSWKIKSTSNNKYLQISGGNLTFENSTSLTFSVSVTSSSFAFTSSAASGNKILSYYNGNHLFNAFTSSNTIYIYKQIVNFSNYSTSCCQKLSSIGGAVTWNSPTEAKVTWDMIGHVDSWTLKYKIHGAGAWSTAYTEKTSSDSEISTIDSDDDETDDTYVSPISGLACGTDYDFQIIANPASGYCDKSQTIEDDTEHKYQITLTGSGTVNGGTFKVNSTAAATVTSCNGTNNVSLAATASTGYDFTSWSVSKNAGGSVTPASSTSASTTFSMPAEDVTVNATFTAQTYDITYKDEGGSAYSGSNESSLPATHTYDAATALDDGEKDGYTFLGWYTDEDCTVGPITSVGATAYTADFTLYAKWAADGTKRVTISAPTHGSISVTYTGMESALTSGYRDIDENTVLTITATPSTGYQLSSLKIDDDAISSGDTHTLTADITISATFTTITYTISYENMTGATNHKDNPATYTIEDDDITLGDASKTGYTFDGWFTDNGVWSDEVEEIEGGSYGNVTLYAKWTVIAYTLAWSSNGGDDLTGDYTKGSTDYSTTLTPPNTPTRTGYTFAKWNTATDGSGDDYTGTMPAANTTYYAQWNINSYNVSVTANENVTITATPSGGSAIDEEDDADVEYNKTVTLNYSSLTSGLTWGGWRVYKSDDASTTVTVSGTGDGATFTMPAYDVVVTAYTYGDVVAWCDPQITITGGTYLTSTKDIYVHATSTTSNLLSISSSDLGDATSIDFKYLDADNSDAEVAKASSLFRLCNDGSSNYNVADGTMSINVSASNECDLTYSIKYTPTAYNTINHYKLQLTIKKGSNVLKTMNYDLYGRSLPEEFVLAIKSPKDSKWYALPNNILNASTLVSTTTMGSNIIVDNNTTPTKAMVAADTTAYKASGRYAATSNMYGVRFQSCIEVDSKYPYLQVMGTPGTNYVKTSNTGSSTLQDLYLKSEDFGAYTITVPSSGAGDKRFGINKGGNMGYFASNTDQLSSDVYLLPIGVKSKLINATVNEWGRHDALVVADISEIAATKVDGKLGETESDDLYALSDAVAENTYLVRLSDDIDLSGKSGESLTLRWYNEDDDMVGASAVVIPSIIGTGDEDNWSELESAPTDADIVVIEGDITVDEDAKAKRIIIDQLSGSGKLNIDAGKALVVAEKVKKLSSTDFVDTEATDIVLGSTEDDGNGALLMGENDGKTKATVKFYVKAGKNGSGQWINQFIGTPFNDENKVLDNYYGTQLYVYSPTKEGTYPSGNNNWWSRLEKTDGMTPFKGYNLLTTQAAGSVTLTMKGTLVAGADQEIDLAYGSASRDSCENMLANSWLAPIHIDQFETKDFGGAEATIYIFNAGTPEQYSAPGSSYSATDAAGQYNVLPIASAPWVSPKITVIPSMQSFSVFTTAASQTMTLEYEKLVYNPAKTDAGIVPNRVKKREGEVAPEVVKLHVSAVSGYAANAFVLGREDFTDGFDNGWDGRYMEGDEEAPQLFSLSADGNMSVNCVPEIEGTVLSFKAGSLDKNYTFIFEYNDAEELYLKDLETDSCTLVQTGVSYDFKTDDKKVHNRFVLTRYNSPQWTTDLEPTPDPSLKGRENGFKFVEDQKIYILYRGVLYDATGKRVEERRAE